MFLRALLGLAAASMVAACESPTKRFPASEYNGTTLAGLRVNPVNYSLAPKWEVKIHNGQANEWKVGDLKTTKFKLGKPEELKEFYKYITDLKNENEAEAKAKGKKKGFLPKNASNALDEIHELTSLVISRPLSDYDRNDALMHIAELVESFNYNFKYPIRGKVWIAAAPITVLNELNNPVMSDEAIQSTNIQADANADLSKIDPASSSFWKNPGDVSQLNLYYGHNRKSLVSLSDACTYDEPKDGYGVNGGFSMKCNGKKWKIKFGSESKVEPFNVRLAWALGYNSIPVDYVDGVKLVYDRKVLLEYNSRKELNVDLKSVFGFTYYEIQIQKKLDPFTNGIAGAILKSGKRISSEELKRSLLNSQEKNSEAVEGNYNVSFESQIQYLVLREGNVEPGGDKDEKKIGAWNWNSLGHYNRREVRAFGILAAFLNMYDTRLDNNKIIVKSDSAGNKHLTHLVSDMGSGMGNAQNVTKYTDGEPNQFPWEFIARRKPVREGQSPFMMKGYNSILKNVAFERAQLEDAKWIARRLAALSEQQLTDALVASGWTAAETKLYLEKLISRRDNLVKVLGLDNEIALLRPLGVDRRFSYDPTKQAKPVALGSVSGGKYVTAPIGNNKIVGGQVVKN